MEKHTNEELVELIRNSTGKDQEDYLVMLYNQNYGMIRQICKSYSAFECIEDLEQEGFFGIRNAVDHYDPEKGSFIGYAAQWIRQAVRRYIDECGSVLRLPVHIRDKIFRYNQVVRDHERQYGAAPTTDVLMRALCVNKSQLRQIKKYSLLVCTVSLDKSVSAGDDAFSLGDMIADSYDQYEMINDKVDDELAKSVLWGEVAQLDEKHSNIILKRFKHNQTLKEIADSIGITAEGARRLQNHALQKLRRSDKIRMYAEDYIAAKAYQGTGLSTFLSSGTSVTERTALKIYDSNIRSYHKTIELNEREE